MATDFGTIARRIEAVGREVGHEMGSGLRVIGEAIMTDVKASRAGRGVPVDTGALRASGRVTGPTGLGEPRVRLSFGGASAPYALRQHEDLTLRHKVGEARYLVRGVERFQADGFDQVESALRANAREGLERAARS
jgi:hypothetical protein